MEQLLCHIAGDYVLQSDYCALNKSKRSLPCFIHVLLYTACFLVLTISWKALLVIGITHFILDRWHFIIRRIIWFKNHLNPYLLYVPFKKCNVTGYFDNILNEVEGKPYETEHINIIHRKTSSGTWTEKDIIKPRLNYISIWLYIATDNFLHLTINYLALKYFT